MKKFIKFLLTDYKLKYTNKEHLLNNIRLNCIKIDKNIKENILIKPNYIKEKNYLL